MLDGPAWALGITAKAAMAWIPSDTAHGPQLPVVEMLNAICWEVFPAAVLHVVCHYPELQAGRFLEVVLSGFSEGSLNATVWPAFRGLV